MHRFKIGSGRRWISEAKVFPYDFTLLPSNNSHYCSLPLTDTKLEVETWHQSFSERERERENWSIGALESCLICLHHGGFIGSRSGS